MRSQMESEARFRIREGRSSTIIEQHALCEYDPRNKKKQWVAKAAAREKHLISCIRKKFEKDGEQGSIIRGRKQWSRDTEGQAYTNGESTTNHVFQTGCREEGRPSVYAILTQPLARRRASIAEGLFNL